MPSEPSAYAAANSLFDAVERDLLDATPSVVSATLTSVSDAASSTLTEVALHYRRLTSAESRQSVGRPWGLVLEERVVHLKTGHVVTRTWPWRAASGITRIIASNNMNPFMAELHRHGVAGTGGGTCHE